MYMGFTFDTLYFLVMTFGLIPILGGVYLAWHLTKESKGQAIAALWLYRLVFIVLFLISYLLLTYSYGMSLLGNISTVVWLHVLMICTGLFIFIDCRISGSVVKNVEDSNKALANANVHMAMLYSQLDTLKENLEKQKDELKDAYEKLQDTQSQMIVMEKMAALGQLIAGIAHEINTPMGAINASSENIVELLSKGMLELFPLIKALDNEDVEFVKVLMSTCLEFKGGVNSKEDRVHRKRIEGYLEEHEIEHGDVIADTLVEMHLYGDLDRFLPLFKRNDALNVLNTAYFFTRLYESSQAIQMSTQKVKKIIFALKNFAHMDREGEATPFDIKQNINDVITLYENQIKYGVDLVLNYDNSPLQIVGFPDELGQVWTNLIHNALQAMEYKGTLSIDISQDADAVFVNITDSGKGIPKELEKKIFEPFFTTKRPGEGSGMGLHIISKILEKHQGTISFNSMPGRTTFTVSLPKILK